MCSSDLAGAQVTVAVANTSWVAVGQPLFIETAGSFTVVAVLSVTSLRVMAQSATANAAAGAAIVIGWGKWMERKGAAHPEAEAE